MNKKNFLSELEKKLNILNDDERKDIINEYNDTIEEKIKHGKSEIDAINDFGSIDTLVNDILSAYKINPDYTKKEEPKAKDVINTSESVIKKWASELSDFAKKTSNDIKNSGFEFSLEVIFEMIIKFILLLVICALLRIPFYLIEGLGASILNMALYPLDVVFVFIWKFVIGIIYLVVCVLIGFTMYKDYFKGNNDKDTKTPKKKKTVKKELANDDLVETKKKDNTIVDIIIIIAKIFIMITLGVPLILSIIGIFTGFSFMIYLLCVGVNTIGLLVLLLGIGIFFSFFLNIIFNLMNNKFKLHISTIIISIILIMTGGFITLFQILNFNYYNYLPDTNLNLKEINYVENLTRTTYIETTGKKEFVINNDLEDNQIVINVKYNNELISITKNNQSLYNSENIIDIQRNYYPEKLLIKKIYDIIINDLKNNELHNYSKLYEYDVIIEVNENTRAMIK